MHSCDPVFARVLVVSLACTALAGARSDPFASLSPTVQLSQDERDQLDQRQIVVKILPAENQELAVLAAGSLNSDTDALISSIRDIAELKKGRYVPQIHRLSSKPAVDDFRDLTLDDVDVREMTRCRPNDCGLKLSPDEIASVRAAGSNLNEVFRRVLVRRAEHYLNTGQQTGRQEFDALLQHSHYLQRMPELAGHLERYPAAQASGAESFLYWSKEQYAWKPMITITHVTILRGNGRRDWPDVVVAARDIFSTRYTSASLTLTLLLHDQSDASRRYLVYMNRTWVDGVRAWWRPLVERRIKSQAKTVFAAVRDRIERGGFASAARE